MVCVDLLLVRNVRVLCSGFDVFSVLRVLVVLVWLGDWVVVVKLWNWLVVR